MAKFWYILKIHSIVIINVLNVEHEKTQGSKHSLVEMGNTMRGKDLTQKYQLFLTVLFDTLMEM